MEVRKCSGQDKNIWVQLNKEHMDYEIGGNSYWEETKEKGIKKLEDSFELALKKDPSIILLLFEEDGKTIGFANLNTIYSVWSNGEALIVDDFFIKEDYRGRGFGQEGLVLIERYAIDNNIKRIQFHSVIEDERSIKIWEDYGYHPIDMKFYMRYI